MNKGLKRIAIIVLFSLFSTLSAQYNAVHYVFMDYTVGVSGQEIVRDQFLLFNSDESYYLQPVSKRFNSYNDLFTAYSRLESFLPIESIYSRIDNFKVFGIGRLQNEVPFYVDDLPKIEWEIQDSYKEILGYKARLATGFFRGRIYKVWFAAEIPYSLGPWKLRGLPGLILEAEDEDGFFKYIVKTILLNNKEELIPKIVQYYNTHKNVAIPYSEFVQKQNQEFKIAMSQLLASFPQSGNGGYKPAPLREFIQEKTFEWEKE